MPKVTIKSMADSLGLSRNTISLALNDSDIVAPETKKMVLQHALSVGYSKIPEKLLGETEKQRQESKPHRILIIRRSEKAVYWERVISGITEEASKSNCIVSMATVTKEDEVKYRIPIGLDETIEAVIFMNTFSKSYTEFILSRGIIGIFLDNSLELFHSELLGDVIKSENKKSLMRLTNHLIQQGMKKIAFINDDSTSSESMAERFDGYRAAMEKAELPLDEAYIYRNKKADIFYNLEFIENVISDYPKIPDAIVCANDTIAQFVISVLRKKGYRVPEDVAVTGFDNNEEKLPDAFITTVNSIPRELGERIIQQILWRMAHPDTAREIITVEGKPIFRASSIKKI